MRYLNARVLATAAIAVLALAACGSSNKSSTATTDTTTAPSNAYAPPATNVSPTTAAASGSTTVALAKVDNPKVDPKVLVDSKGMTLYVWDSDKTAGKASCTGACATAWPPLYVTGTATYGAGLTASMFSTVTGPNGNKQLAVNGKPLYLWAADQKAGQATGQGVNGFYVVAANGNKVDSD